MGGGSEETCGRSSGAHTSSKNPRQFHGYKHTSLSFFFVTFYELRLDGVLSLCFNPRGHGSLSAVDIGEHCEHDGSLWTPYLNPSTICAPFETRSTGASSVEPTRSLSWPTPCSPPPARFLRRST